MTSLVLGEGLWYSGLGGGLLPSKPYSFYTDLEYTLLPFRTATGSYTYTRGTAGGTITDFEGLIKNVGDDEVMIDGARRVENLITTDTSTLAISANKTVTVGIGTFVFSMGNGVSGVATFTGTATGSSGTLTQNTTNRTTKTLTITVAGTIIITASVAALNDLQLEEITGQVVTAPSEYVSNGLAEEHGTNVDGAKYFKYENANTVASNVVTEIRGSNIADAILEGYSSWEGRTNHCYYSNDFFPWTGAGGSVATSNLGTYCGIAIGNLDKITSGGATAGNQSLGGGFIGGSTSDFTMSGYIEYGDSADSEVTKVGFIANGSTPVNSFADITWTSGTPAIAASGVDPADTVRIEETEITGIWRFQLTKALSITTTSATYYIYPNITNTNDRFIYSNGIQGEIGSVASPLIPTLGAAIVTRPDTFLTYDAANYTEYGTILINVKFNDSGIGKQLGGFEETSSTNQKLSIIRTSSSLLRVQTKGASSNSNNDSTLTISEGNSKIAVTWSRTGIVATIVAAVDGVIFLSATYNAVSFPTAGNIDRFSIAHRYAGGASKFVNDNIKMVHKWDRTSTTAELKAMTS